MPAPCELPSRPVSSSLTPTAPIAPSECSVWAQDTPTISIALAISLRRRLRSKAFHHQLGPPDCPFCPQFPFMEMLLQGEQDMTPFSLLSALPMHLTAPFKHRHRVPSGCQLWPKALRIQRCIRLPLAFRSSSSLRHHSNRKSEVLEFIHPWCSTQQMIH